MLKIRLQRIGKRGQAYFRLVVTEHTTKPQGKYLELLGSYDPHKNEIKAEAERIKYWISQGAQLTETVNNLLVTREIIEGERVRAWKPKKRDKKQVASDQIKTTGESKSGGQEEQPEKVETKPIPEPKEEKSELETAVSPSVTV